MGYKWRNRNVNNLIMECPDKGCEYAPKCTECPYPRFGDKCLDDLSEKERQKYLSGAQKKLRSFC